MNQIRSPRRCPRRRARGDKVACDMLVLWGRKALRAFFT
jgi:hypothetical protein